MLRVSGERMFQTGSSLCKGPEVGGSLTRWKNSGQTSAAAAHEESRQ